MVPQNGWFMKMYPSVLALAFLVLPGVAAAEIKELSQADLRKAVSERGTISTRRLIAGVEDYSGGRVVDIRAFDVEGTVTYRILIRQDTGQIGTLMVDGQTGRAVQADSDIGRQIAAVSAASEGTPQLSNNGNASDNANGRSNANGRGNSNGRGNAGGNSGGNGSDKGNSGGRKN